MSAAPAFRGLILAAGKGTRFPLSPDAPRAKVLRPVAGRPMIEWVIDAMAGAGIEDVTIVVGVGADDVRQALGGRVRYAVQDVQLGSGHAAACARWQFAGFDGGVVVMCGDSPLFTPATIMRLMREHVEKAAAVTLATARLDDPTGYGRVMRGDSGRIAAIVEEKRASEAERRIDEINGGAYVFDSAWLFSKLDRMCAGDAEEYNLTDMVRVAFEQGRTVESVGCDGQEVLGVNTPADLAAAEEILRSRASR